MRDIVEEIWSTLRQNKLRTALTGFSVAWGIFMIISLIGAGNGVMNSVSGNISLVPNSIEIINRRTSKPYAGYKEGRYIEFDSHDVDILDEGRSCRVVVPDSQLSLAIGKEGQNARLAAKLTGWKIDIKSDK